MCRQVLEYVSAAGVRERGSLGRLWSVPFESVRPERRFSAFRGQGNWCGWYWSATCGGHVGYESWLERDHLMLLDFDPLVTGTASQPFRLSWTRPDGKRVRHTPDFFVRRADGTGLVVDVRRSPRSWTGPSAPPGPRSGTSVSTTAASAPPADAPARFPAPAEP
ncbi:TnsA-like heteromeric transposase endonuclease subunit [Streptomyces althioticus]